MAVSVLDKKRGFSFPFGIEGRVSFSGGLAYIREGISSRLSILFFELLMKPEGSRVHEALFDPMDEVFFQSLRFLILESLSDYELITLSSVRVVPFPDSDHAALASVTYTVKNTDVTDTYQEVFSPFAPSVEKGLSS